jgi:hypothetical protein
MHFFNWYTRWNIFGSSMEDYLTFFSLAAKIQIEIRVKELRQCSTDYTGK